MSRPSFHFDERIARAETLPSRFYFDPDTLELERRRIFHNTWQLVGRLEQVAERGSYFTTEILGEPILIVRDSEGALRGFHNVCRHRAGPVARESGCLSVFQCGYHGWTYSLDGRLLGTPDWDGVENFDRDGMGLIPIRVDIWEQFIFVNLGDSGDLDEFMRFVREKTGLFDVSKMRFVERRDYVVECNWKVYVDNYAEGYHIPIVHPSLMRELDFEHYRTITDRFSSLQDAPIKGGVGRDRRYQPTDTQGEALYFWVFPNLMLNIYPDNLSTNLIIPLGVGRTLTIFEWFFEAPESAEVQEKIRRTISLSDEVQQEDIGICEAVQRGLGSMSYDRGRYSVKRESGLHHFHSLWREFMV
jgi:choline monooxygenase